MPRFNFSNSSSLHGLAAFLNASDYFGRAEEAPILRFYPGWTFAEPVALVAAAAWGAWCRRKPGAQIQIENRFRPSGIESAASNFAARMKLYDSIGLNDPPIVHEHEESGKFMPLAQIRSRQDVRPVLANISAILHLQDDLEALEAVQHAISEMLNNVLEHSGSPDGAFVSAMRFRNGKYKRVSVAVADCGIGIREHLRRARPEFGASDEDAVMAALQWGVTGAMPGPYGPPDNMGAGLFITRAMAKGTGGHFALISGSYGYKLLRESSQLKQTELFDDAGAERHKRIQLGHPWQGTIVAVEIATNHIADWAGFLEWARDRPHAQSVRSRIKFT